MFRAAVAAAALLFAYSALAVPIVVKVSFIEALAPKDTTSSERFQKEFEGAIKTGSAELGPKLRKCGYELENHADFYDASDPLQAKERGERAAKEGTWLIIGPRRSNHYLLLTQGAPETPTVSLMASSSEMSTLTRSHLSMAPLNSEMARNAAFETARRIRRGSNRSYLSIVSQDCLSCQDFADEFVVAGRAIGLREAARLLVIGDVPDVTVLRDKMAQILPAFVLLPDFSKVAAHVMAGIHDVVPGAFFVGGDGWGDARFGFVQNSRNIDTVTGFTVRGFPPFETGMRTFALGKHILAGNGTDIDPVHTSSGPALAILKAMDSTATLLCRARPRSAEAFRKAFEKEAKRDFSAPWGVSLYELHDGQITYIHRGNPGR